MKEGKAYIGDERLHFGDKVKMVNCMEADRYKDKVWTCRTESFKPKNYPTEEVIFLEGFAGWFLCKYLERVQ